MKKKSNNILPQKEININAYDNTNIQKNNKKNIQEYRTVLSNPFTNELSFGLKRMTLHNFEEELEFTDEVKNTSMFFSVNDFLGEQKIKDFNGFTDRQSKIWDFVLTKIGFLIKENSNNLSFYMAELIDFLGLSFQTKTIRNMSSDLAKIGSIRVKYEDISRSNDPFIGFLFAVGGVGTNKNGELILTLGPWFEALKKRPELHSYMFINNKTYTASKTNKKSDPYFIVARKIHEIFKNNLKRKKGKINKDGYYEITVSAQTFIKSLAWEEKALKKDTKKYMTTLLDVFDRIQKDQNIIYDIIDSKIKGLNAYERFKETKFVFSCKDLEEAYKEIGYN